MRPGRRHRVTGIALLALAAALAVVGQHDGVLGMTPPEEFPAPGQAPADVMTRVVVDGPLSGDDPVRKVLSEEDEGSVLVKVHLEQPDPSHLVIIVVLQEQPPAPGTVLVVAGSIQTLMGKGGGAAIVRLDAHDVREPVLF